MEDVDVEFRFASTYIRKRLFGVRCCCRSFRFVAFNSSLLGTEIFAAEGRGAPILSAMVPSAQEVTPCYSPTLVNHI